MEKEILEKWEDPCFDPYGDRSKWKSSEIVKISELFNFVC